jgi:hypothetical protein
VAKRQFTKLTGSDFGKTLARRFVPLADSLRDLLTKVGLRPYIVRIVRTRWSGPYRGQGQEYVVSETDVLPTPKISDLSGITAIVQPIGLDEIGGIMVSQISGRFTEEELRGLSADGSPPEVTDNVFWEIEFPRPDGPGERRRFVMRSAPHYYSGRLQWVVRLERANEDRARSGELRS